jgi:hypothetical protein
VALELQSVAYRLPTKWLWGGFKMALGGFARMSRAGLQPTPKVETTKYTKHTKGPGYKQINARTKSSGSVSVYQSPFFVWFVDFVVTQLRSWGSRNSRNADFNGLAVPNGQG